MPSVRAVCVLSIGLRSCELTADRADDNENKFGVGSSPEEQALLSQWLFFQASGQGPYFGQAAHFKMCVELTS